MDLVRNSLSPLGGFCCALWMPLVFFALQQVQAGPQQVALMKHLFRSNDSSAYSVLERPVESDKFSVNVEFQFEVRQLVQLNDQDGWIKAVLILHQDWKAYNLMWNPNDFGGIEYLVVDSKQVWHPDILLYNSVSDFFDTSIPVKARIRFDGMVHYNPPAIIKAACSVNIRWFPFDEQECQLRFGSWTYAVSALNLMPMEDTADVAHYIESSEWSLIGASITRNVQKYDDEEYVDVTLTLRIQRRSLFFYFNILGEVVLVSIMALMVFKVPVACEEKIVLSINIFLFLGILTQAVLSHLPRASDALPQICIYTTGILILCSTSNFLSVIVLFVYLYPNLAKPPPNWLRFGVCIRLARLLCINIPYELLDQAGFEKKKMQEKKANAMRRRAHGSDLEMHEMVRVEGEHFRPRRDECRDADAGETPADEEREDSVSSRARGGRMPRTKGSVERHLDSLARTRMGRDRQEETLGVEFQRHRNQNQRREWDSELEMEELGVGEDSVGGRSEARKRRPSYLDLWPEWPPRDPAHAMPHMCCQLRSMLKYVLRELQALSNRVHSDMADDVVRTQWHFVADVVDRFLFTVFLIYTVAFTVTTLLMAPNHMDSLTLIPSSNLKKKMLMENLPTNLTLD